MSAVLLDAEGNEVEERKVQPSRVLLSKAAVDRLAELCGAESPTQQMLASSGSLETIAERLGGLGADPAPESTEEAADEPGPGLAIDQVLADAGLLDDDGVPTEQGRAILTVWHSPTLAVEIEQLLVLRKGRVRIRAWHRNRDGWVVCLATVDGKRFELTWLSAEDWWLELGRAAYLDVRRLDDPPTSLEPLPDVIETPWELLLATGEAATRRRPELLDPLVANYSGMTTGGDSDALAAVDDATARQWHDTLGRGSRGRLHAAIIGRSENDRPGAGLVEWVLFHDGWRSLEAFKRDGWNMVRVQRKGPADLPRELAVRAATVTS